MSDARFAHLDPYTYEGEDVVICLAYWNEMRGERFAPSWREFDWNRIPSQIIPFFTVVDIGRDPASATYRFFGTALTRAHGHDMTGRSPLELEPADMGQSFFEQYLEVAGKREPLLYTSVLHERAGRSAIAETALRLPFSKDGETVTQIVNFADLRKDFEAARKKFVEDKRESATP